MKLKIAAWNVIRWNEAYLCIQYYIFELKTSAAHYDCAGTTRKAETRVVALWFDFDVQKYLMYEPTVISEGEVRQWFWGFENGRINVYDNKRSGRFII